MYYKYQTKDNRKSQVSEFQQKQNSTTMEGESFTPL